MYKCTINLNDGPENMHVYAVIIDYEPDPYTKHRSYRIQLLSLNRYIPVFITVCKSSREALKIAKRICEEFPFSGSFCEDEYNDTNTIDREKFSRMVEGWK